MRNLIRLLAIAILFVASGCHSKEEKKRFKFETQSAASVKKENPSNADGIIPPSKQVTLDNKGIGPITSLVLPEAIDPVMVSEGEALFKSKCIACHTTHKNFIGPPMAGLLELRSPEWLMNMMMNTTEMLTKDPLSKALMEEYNGSVMLDQKLPEKESRAILEYLRTLN